MSVLAHFGVAVLPVDAGTQVITAITTQITDNIAPVLVLVGFSAGLALVMRWFKKSAKVKA